MAHMGTTEICSGLRSGFGQEKLKKRGRLEKAEPSCEANI